MSTPLCQQENLLCLECSVNGRLSKQSGHFVRKPSLFFNKVQQKAELILLWTTNILGCKDLREYYKDNKDKKSSALQAKTLPADSQLYLLNKRGWEQTSKKDQRRTVVLFLAPHHTDPSVFKSPWVPLWVSEGFRKGTRSINYQSQHFSKLPFCMSCNVRKNELLQNFKRNCGVER